MVTKAVIRDLICCCCSAATRGRQWWNRDKGYGLCDNCIVFCKADIKPGETHMDYGVRGVHYDLASRSH
jgi:hypothetical protein